MNSQMYTQHISGIFHKDYTYIKSKEDLQKAIIELEVDEGILLSPHKKSDETFSVVRTINDLYLCNLYDGDEWYALNIIMDKEEDLDVFLGHESNHPAKYFHPLKDAIIMTITYYLYGKRDKNYCWEKD